MLLAKNIFHAAVFVIVMVVAGLLAALRLGVRDGMVLAMTAAWLLFVLPANLAAGNIFSLTMPYRVNPGRISRQRRSQGAALLSLLMQVGLVAIGALVYGVSARLDVPFLAVPAFLLLGAVAAAAWFKVLGNADDTANQRKEQLIAALMKADD